MNYTAPEQLLSLLGSALILLAYFLTVAKPDRKRVYFSLSLLGGAVLLAVAIIYRNIGLIILETAWISINIWGLWKDNHAAS
jgi:lipid-A-disaccharide synthase-like uncharacterized protein